MNHARYRSNPIVIKKTAFGLLLLCQNDASQADLHDKSIPFAACSCMNADMKGVYTVYSRKRKCIPKKVWEYHDTLDDVTWQDLSAIEQDIILQASNL